MEIEDIEVRWNYGWGNDPKLKILVDELPTWDEVIYKKKKINGNIVYYGEIEGYVDFFVNPHSGGALGGKITLEDGTEEDASGSWSSRSGFINRTDLGKDVMDVSLTDRKEVMKKGYTFRSGHITVEKVENWLEENDVYWHLEKKEKHKNLKALGGVDIVYKPVDEREFELKCGNCDNFKSCERLNRRDKYNQYEKDRDKKEDNICTGFKFKGG